MLFIEMRIILPLVQPFYILSCSPRAFESRHLKRWNMTDLRQQHIISFVQILSQPCAMWDLTCPSHKMTHKSSAGAGQLPGRRYTLWRAILPSNLTPVCANWPDFRRHSHHCPLSCHGDQGRCDHVTKRRERSPVRARMPSSACQPGKALVRGSSRFDVRAQRYDSKPLPVSSLTRRCL